MVMIVMATYDEICDDCEDNNDETGGRGTQGHNCNFKHFNPAYMMIWMMITMMMTILMLMMSVWCSTLANNTLHLTGRWTSSNVIFRELYCMTWHT